MTAYSDKLKTNQKKLDELKGVIPNAQITIQGETLNIDIVVKEIKNSKNQKKVIATADHEELPSSHNVIRLYLPLMGAGGYVPTKEELKKLFQEEPIMPPDNAFLNFKGKPYSIKQFSFVPLEENVYKGKVAYYGNGIPEFHDQK